MAEKNKKIDVGNILIRYGIGTLGLALVAIGVALSIKSDLGTSPVSCPPYVVNLFSDKFTVGEYTIMMHLIFLLVQVLLLGKKFKARYLMQIPAALVFGLLTDAAIWAFDWITVPNYMTQMILCILTVIVTALGISLEVVGEGWMLAGDQTTAALAEVSHTPFSTVKIIFDVFLVAISAIFAWIVWRNPFGNGEYFVIREGTLILAIFVGLCMKLTDPLCKKLFGKAVKKKN